MEIKLSIENILDSTDYPKTTEKFMALFKATGFLPIAGDCLRPQETEDDSFDLTVIERMVYPDGQITLWVTEHMVQLPFLDKTAEQRVLEHNLERPAITPSYLYNTSTK